MESLITSISPVPDFSTSTFAVKSTVELSLCFLAFISAVCTSETKSSMVVLPVVALLATVTL